MIRPRALEIFRVAGQTRIARIRAASRRAGTAFCLLLIGVAGACFGGGRKWTISDIVDVREIQSVAVSASGNHAAYVVREPSVATDSIGYALLEVGLRGSARPKQLLRANYIGEVTRRPFGHVWTILADVGNGVQLYDIDDRGGLKTMATSSGTLLVGTYAGDIPTNGGPQRMGIWSYEWSPDGSMLWYSDFRVRSRARSEEVSEDGVPYDDRRDSILAVMHPHTRFVGFELHVERADGTGDHVVAFVPADQFLEETNLSRPLASALWMPDSRRIQYTTNTLDPDGRIVVARVSVDVRTGASSKVTKASPWWVMAVPSADGQGWYEVRQIKGSNHLLEYSRDGLRMHDRGRVPYTMVGMMADYPGGTWIDAKTGAQILSVLYHHHIGLVGIPQTAADRTWESLKDSLNPCDFSPDLNVGVCVRQSQTLPPEVVTVSGGTGAMRVIAQPNAAYRGIAPLRVELHHWKNRYGQVSDGYVIYPRGFSPGRKYPLIMVTHVDGAINTFADREMIQAEIPVQALAEGGFMVAEANTPWADLTHGQPWQFRALNPAQRAVRQREMRFIQGPVASMQAAAEDLARSGTADPDRTGIAGYSDGAALSLFAMTQSKTFRVASIDDGAAGAAAGEYWEDGMRSAQFLYGSLYGGSPFSADPAVIEAYRRFCPDFRAEHFAGPLLEQPTAAGAITAFARLASLRKAGIPYDLVFYPHESHVFWDPRASAASMQRTLDWFGYWLQGRVSEVPAKADEYKRWNAMRKVYAKRCPACVRGLGPWHGRGGGHGSADTTSGR